jgi:hypothetical protein
MRNIIFTFILVLICLEGYSQPSNKIRSAFDNSNINTFTQASRKKVNCKAFNQNVQPGTMQAAFLSMSTDSFFLPSDFPNGPKGEKPCGCHIFLASSYYLSTASPEEVYQHYRKNSPKDYQFGEPTMTAEGNAIIEFLVKDKGTGQLTIHADKMAYTVVYTPDRKKCNCGGKRKK